MVFPFTLFPRLQGQGQSYCCLPPSVALSPLPCTSSLSPLLMPPPPPWPAASVCHLPPGYFSSLPPSHALASPLPPSIASTPLTDLCLTSLLKMPRGSQLPIKPELHREAFQVLPKAAPGSQSSLTSLQFQLYTLLPGCTLGGL